MLVQSPPKGIIFDLGDVLLTWSPNTSTKISAQLMRKILSSTIWSEYECGYLEQDVCYDQIAQYFSVSAFEVADAFAQARGSLQPNHALIAVIRHLKRQFEGVMEIYAMSNISKEDFAILSKTKIFEWSSVFDQVFVSGHVGMRKPDPEFYRHVLLGTNLAPQETLFIDDKTENVLAAKSLGIDSIMFNNNISVIHALRSLLNDPTGRAFEFLYHRQRPFNSVTDTGIDIPDNFAQLLLLDTMQDQQLVNLQWGSRRTWNYFREKPVLVPGGYFPDDLDTTSMALINLRPAHDVVASLLEEMLTYVNPDGTFQTYFDWKKPRNDAVVSANVLTCFYVFGRGSDPGLESTLRLIHDVLQDRTYLQGTRYYPSPDCCLFFFGRLLQSSSDNKLQSMIGPMLKERVQERNGMDGSALDLAMRILVCKTLDIDYDDDRHALLDLQCEDGGWEAGWMYRYGSTGIQIGNRGVTTALAIRALEP